MIAIALVAICCSTTMFARQAVDPIETQTAVLENGTADQGVQIEELGTDVRAGNDTEISANNQAQEATAAAPPDADAEEASAVGNSSNNDTEVASAADNTFDNDTNDTEEARAADNTSNTDIEVASAADNTSDNDTNDPEEASAVDSTSNTDMEEASAADDESGMDSEQHSRPETGNP
jgi:hypothetical protein